jgi:hypothetical protein
MRPCRYWFKRNFFPQPVFERMRDRLRDGRLAKAPNSLNADNFGLTTGVVIMFNLEGEKILRKKDSMKEVMHFFDAIRLNGTNSYGMTLEIALSVCLPAYLPAYLKSI